MTDEPTSNSEMMSETAYLMRSPANARRLLEAVQRLEASGGEHHDCCR